MKVPFQIPLTHFVERLTCTGGRRDMAAVIMRRSINAFLGGYQAFTSIAAVLVLPASTSVLLSQALVPLSPPVLEATSLRLAALFEAARFPVPEQLRSLLTAKLAQTAFSFFATLPLVATFLLLAKASVIHVATAGRAPRLGPPPMRSVLPLYRRIVPIHLFNSFLLLSANATIFAVLFLVFNAADIVLGISSNASLLALSALGAVLYSVVIASATVICNLAIVVSAVVDCGGPIAILKAQLLVRGRLATALGLALPANLGMAAAEALFQYRVVRQYNLTGGVSLSLLWEAVSIAYLHALLLVLEVIINCMLFKACTTGRDHKGELEPEEKLPLLV